ncbi:helix-turn-helix transcriptional regulator [Paenibacillus tritici]|uniref:helix-turn-helix domain-containing protein n=1 Tax=Paenibacillus tritici TaxID=1873425 RepID=UPI001BAC456E|nr:helix-turn-helix transcriptional regulator [Paenibacillus tritici]QUL57608.1 helix-turn-helix transcriptional regulator [Paenibacillus tritici]
MQKTIDNCIYLYAALNNERTSYIERGNKVGLKIKLRELRERKGLSVNAVSKNTGIKPDQLNAFENDPSLVGLTAATSLMYFYDVNLDDVIWK